jgi:hypothetical protein
MSGILIGFGRNLPLFSAGAINPKTGVLAIRLLRT